MIKNIFKLKNFGIFQNYFHNISLKDYNHYNLFYGWNGSGKSTLTSLFECIEKKEQSQEYPLSEWIVDTNESQITQDNVKNNTLNIRVFNKSFVERNVFTSNDKIKGIIYISEEQGNDKNELEQKESELKIKNSRNNEIETKLNGNPDDKKAKGLITLNEKFLSDAAKSIKANFKVIEIEDTRLLNYDKTKLSSFIHQNENSIKTKKNTLSVSEIEQLSKSIRPQDKAKIDNSLIYKYDTSILEKTFKRVKQLQETVITTKAIDKLKENPIIANWVYQGLQENIHEKDATICEFCNQPLPENRIAELNKHFSDEFEKLKEALSKGIEWIDENKIKTEFPLETSLYDEFQSEYKQAIEKYNQIISSLNNKIGEWKNVLLEKQNNPFEISQQTIIEILQPEIEEYDTVYFNVIKYIENHNKKFDGLEEIVKANKQKLELHYVSGEVTKFDYFSKAEQVNKLQAEQTKINTEITSLKSEIKQLKNKLSNETLGLSEFNEKLWKFLGRNDLKLERKNEGGYLIKRNNTEEAKCRNLSEGERTAIALVYFITKLKEDRNKIENTIIVIDDPISSFDSNHLFSACSFIKSHCEQSQQLFIFTHNFWFFKLIRDWFKTKKNRLNNIDEDAEKTLYQFYQLKCIPSIVTNNRESCIVNAGKELIEYDSEYHYLFSKLKSYSVNEYLSLDDCYSCANVIRRVCEAALTFKYPQIRDLRGLIDKTNITIEQKDKIYQFLNKYSHLDRIETIENLNENKFEESKNVILDFMELLKIELPEHYENMCKTISV